MTERPGAMRADLHRSAVFLGLVLLFSFPLLLLPGELPGGVPLPASAAMAVVPLLAALAAARLTSGRTGVRRTIHALTRWRVRHGWWWPVLAGVMPLVLLASAGVVSVSRGDAGAGTVHTSPVTVVVMAVVFVLSGLTEQVGWTGHLQPLWQPWLGRLGSALAIGLVWGLWHVPGYVQSGWGAEWIGGQVAFSVVLRVVIQELADASGGGVTAAAVVQAGSNTAWLALPADLHVPGVAALATFAVAATIVGRRLLRPTYRPAGALTVRTERG